MARVKIILGKDETMQEAEESLFKALNSHRNGEVHKEDFSDPAMRDVVARMQSAHDEIYAELMREIEEVLDQEYTDGNF